jgi:Mn-dependent DtxR family transcriptional regulator
MTEEDKRKADELLRKRRLAANGLVDQPDSKESDPIAEEKREEEGAVTAAALHRSG